MQSACEELTNDSMFILSLQYKLFLCMHIVQNDDEIRHEVTVNSHFCILVP